MQAEDIAAELAREWGQGRQVAPFSDRGDLDAATASRAAAALVRRRLSAGARIVGRKIGFSNRTIWPIYGIDAPIWGAMFDDTVADVAPGAPGAEVRLDGLTEPRIEPEIAFGLAAVPSPGMDDAGVLACCAWVAHGVELVHSPYPGWRFGTADAIAANALHGRMLLGPRREAGADLLAPLQDFNCRLSRNGEQQAAGHASNVLEGPLRALRHLADVLSQDPEARPLSAGEIVTTGTLTDALPVRAGERWTTALDGLDLPGMDLRFV